MKPAETIDCVATCRPGLEGVLAGEIQLHGGAAVRKGKRSVYFSTDRAGLYRMNMTLRTAIQVLVPLRTFNARDYKLLYFQARRTNWHQYFRAEKSLRIDVNGRSPNLRNTQYVVHRVKDGIIDTFRKLSGGIRPSIDKAEPEIHVVVHLDGNKVTLCLDSSGVPLFKRGYRQEHGGAPLKEDLAAGILLLGGLKPGTGLVDPVCGSGTFLFEGWMIQNKVAPNLNRGFAFQHWEDFDESLYLEEKQKLEKAALAGDRPAVLGCDNDADVVRLATDIRDSAFPDAGIEIRHSRFQDLEATIDGGLMVANPPYGERIGSNEDLGALYKDLGYAAKRVVPGGQLAVFTTNRKAARQIRLKVDQALTLFNGALEGLLYRYSLKRLGE
ncbi:MAG: class I SAM-dependent RNA methyltransferase [Puniceicoccaceae bacterium]